MTNLPTYQKHPNYITEARFSYSLTEQKIIYRIISQIQDEMIKNVDKNLFGDMLIYIPMKELIGQGCNYRRVREDIKELRKKSYEFEDPLETDTSGKNEHGFIEIGIINYGKYRPSTGDVEFEISREIMPRLLELAKGYTLYNLQIALCLKSTYSQRLYEYCCRFRGHGVWNVSIEDFKILLKIENEKSYSGKLGNGNLKSRILEVAQKEIEALYERGESDLYFVYKLKKTGKMFTDITFKIFSTKNPKHEPTKAEDMQAVFKFFSTFFTKEYERKFSIKAMKRLEELQAYSEFSSKMGEIVDQFNEFKKTNEDVIKLARHILKIDYLVFSN